MILFQLILTSYASELTIAELTYGFSQGGLPLKANIHYLKNTKHNKMILMTGGVHGNEYMGLVQGIERGLAGQNLSYFSSGGVLITIAMVNKDGVYKTTRFDNTGLDLNRSFRIGHKHEQLETKALSEFISNFIIKTKMDFLLAVDYHCCAGAALKAKVTQEKKELYPFIEEQIHKHLPGYKLANTKDVFGKVFKGTLKDYLAKKFNVTSLTMEASSLNEYERIAEHINWWKAILTYFSNTKKASDKEAFFLSKSTFFDIYPVKKRGYSK